jgi:hypothetical protein
MATIRTTEYVVYRHGSNGANQSMTSVMPIGIYSGTGRTATERRQDAQDKAAREHTVYTNQWLDGVPASRVSADTKDTAWETQLLGRPAERFHKVGHQVWPPAARRRRWSAHGSSSRT